MKYIRYYIFGLIPKELIDSGIVGNMDALKHIVNNRIQICYKHNHYHYQITIREMYLDDDGYERINGEIKDINIDLSNNTTEREIEKIIETRI